MYISDTNNDTSNTINTTNITESGVLVFFTNLSCMRLWKGLLTY